MKNIFLFVLLILTPIILYSQVKDSVKTYFLGEIVVTAENKAITKAANTVEISGEDIMDRNSFQINESFRSVPGVNLFQNGRNESLIKLRGFDQRQIGMFLDGVP
jgi:iron complex outermembrane receptor protein